MVANHESLQTEYGIFQPDFRVDPLWALCSAEGGIQTGPFGSQLHQKDYVQVGTPIITVEHLGDNRIVHRNLPCVSDEDKDRLSKYTLRQGDIVFSRVGSVDRRSLVSEAENGWLFSGRCLRVRPDPQKIDSAYLSYFLGLPAFREHIRAIAVGATMPSLNTKLLSNVSIVYPPLSEQRRIAHILGTLDEKIELNRRMNTTLEGMARALFKAWFVDFEPVHAKTEGRWRRGESLPGMPAELYNLFPDKLVPSELGEVPEGWEVKAIEEIVNINPESWSRSNSPFEVKYVDLANTKWGTIQTIQHHLWEDAPSRARRILRPGDTIMSTVRPGNGSYALIGEEELTGSTGFAVLRPSEERFREITYLACTSKENVEWLAHLADGGAYPAIRPEVVGQTRIVIPVCDGPLVNCFSSFVTPLFAKATSNNIESSTTSALRDSLLPRLMSGKANLGDGQEVKDEHIPTV